MLTGAALVVAFFGPGLCYVLAGWRVTGRWLVSTAPAASILLIGWTGWLSGRIGRQPGPVALLLLATGLGVIAGLALRHLARGQAAHPRPVRGAMAKTVGVAAAGLLAAGALTSWLWTRTPGWQDSIPRYWDGTWHGYLIGVVHRTGIVDVDRLVPLDPQLLDWLDYYPSGWHVPVGTAVTLGDGSVPSGYNIGQLLFVAVVLPLGTLSLVRALGLRSRLVLLLAPGSSRSPTRCRPT